MSRLLIPAVLGAVTLGLWSGWRAGAGVRQRQAASMTDASGGQFVYGKKPAAALLPGGPAPGTATLQDWRDLVDSDPSEIRAGDTAHMARIRELARSLSLEDLLSRIDAGMEETISKNSVSPIVGALIQELARRDAARACDLLFRKNYWHSDGDVFEEWGRQDPQAALAWIDAHPKFQDSRCQIIRSWAETNPGGAFQMLQRLEKDGSLKDSDSTDSVMGFFPAWAQKDPEAAVAACASRPDLYFCINARWGEALQVMNPEKRARLISALEAIPDPDFRASALFSCAGFFAGADDPWKAISFTEDQSIPEYRRPEMRRLVLEMWMQRDHPEAAADWFWHSSPPGREADTLQRVLGSWRDYSERQESGPLAWLQTLPPERLPANAAQIFAVAGFVENPVPALRGWLTLQGSGDVSSEAVDRLGQYLSSAPQATRLPALLSEARFPAELKTRLLTAAGVAEE